MSDDWYNFDRMMTFLKQSDDIQLEFFKKEFNLDTYEKAYYFCKDIRHNCKRILEGRKKFMEKYTG